jgi:hypothetical protein
MHDTDPRIWQEWLSEKTDPQVRVSRCQRSRYESTLPGVGDLRQHDRVCFQARVEAQLLDDDSLIVGTSEDICHRGVFINTKDSPPPIDALMRLCLHTMHGVLHVHARIVHRIEDVGFGCEFVDLDENQRVALSLLVSTRSRAPRQLRRIPVH